MLRVVQLQASANMEVEQDLLTIDLQATELGETSQEVQTKLRERVEAALTTVRELKTGNITAESTGFSVRPIYKTVKNKTVFDGYSGTATLQVYGTDTAVLSQLAVNLSSMDLVGMNYSVSPKLKAETEASVQDAAIQAFRDKARTCATSFGFHTFEIQQVSISPEHDYSRYNRRTVRAAGAMPMSASAGSAPDAMESEAGRATVGISVSGSVVLGYSIDEILHVIPGRCC